MDAKTIETGIQQMDPFQLLDRVNTFYNDAWGRLIIFITLALFVIGVVVPYLIQIYQKRFFKLEENKLREGIKKDLMEIMDNKFKELSATIDKEFESNSRENEKHIAEVEAKIFHLQATQMANTNHHRTAVVSYLDTIRPYLKCDDEINFRRALIGLRDCLSSVITEDIEEIGDEGYNIDDLLTKIEDKYKDRRYADLVVEIKKEVKDARKRNKI